MTDIPQINSLTRRNCAFAFDVLARLDRRGRPSHPVPKPKMLNVLRHLLEMDGAATEASAKDHLPGARTEDNARATLYELRRTLEAFENHTPWRVLFRVAHKTCYGAGTRWWLQIVLLDAGRQEFDLGPSHWDAVERAQGIVPVEMEHLFGLAGIVEVSNYGFLREIVHRAEEHYPGQIHAQIGLFYRRQGQLAEGAGYVERELRDLRMSPAARAALQIEHGMNLRAQAKFDAACAQLRDAVEFAVSYLPEGDRIRMRSYQAAIDALTLSGEFQAAHQLLIKYRLESPVDLAAQLQHRHTDAVTGSSLNAPGAAQQLLALLETVQAQSLSHHELATLCYTALLFRLQREDSRAQDYSNLVRMTAMAHPLVLQDPCLRRLVDVVKGGGLLRDFRAAA